MKLLQKKRQKDAEDILNDLVSLPQFEDLAIAIKHNQFGSFCLQADNLDKAENHFNKSLEII